MILLDISIVNVGIPSIQRELHASFSQVQFVVAGYQLAYGVILITGGGWATFSAGNGCS